MNDIDEIKECLCQAMYHMEKVSTFDLPENASAERFIKASDNVVNQLIGAMRKLNQVKME